MARHKTIQTEEQGDPEMEISSMIDCCFLLLIYFLVATSLVSEKKIDIVIPAPGQPSSSNNDIKPFDIVVDENNSVICKSGNLNLTIVEGNRLVTDPSDEANYFNDRNLKELVEQLKSLNGEGSTDPSKVKPVSLSAHPRAKQQRIMDVMSALARAKITALEIKPPATE